MSSFRGLPDLDVRADLQEAAAKAGKVRLLQPQVHAGPEPEAATQELCMGQAKEQLRRAISEGASQADLTALVADLARRTGHPVVVIRDLQRNLEQESEIEATVAAETASIRAEQDRRGLGEVLSLEYLLPAPIADALHVRCRALPTDAVAAAMTYLVAVSGLAKLGTRIVASQAADYRVPANLYAALVARSGAKKSPVSRLLLNAPTQALRQELAEHHDRAMRQWKDETRGLKSTQKPDPPRAAYLHVSDATAEALAGQLQQQEIRGLGMLLHRDELAGLFGSLNAYRSGRGADEELLLEAYDGSGFHSLRVASVGGGRFYDHCHLSIWGTIQPAILSKLVKDGDASGLWARFLFVPLPERVVPLGGDSEIEQRATAAATQTLADTARKLYALPSADYTLSPEAFARFSQYEARCQGDALRAVIPAQSALYGKAAGKVLRVAGLLHILGKVTGEAEDEIGADTIDRAATLVDHLNGWALSFHADVANGGTSDLMRKVHGIALEADGPIQWRNIYDRLSKHQRKEIDAAAVAAAMYALADLGMGKVELTSRSTPVYQALTPLS